jgi:Na+/serine symporter
MRKTNKQDIKTIIALILLGVFAWIMGNILFKYNFPMIFK